MGHELTWFLSVGSAFHLRRVFTTLLWPFWLARCSGVKPVWLMLSTKQNALRRIFTTSLFPFHAASCSAVLPNCVNVQANIKLTMHFNNYQHWLLSTLSLVKGAPLSNSFRTSLAFPVFPAAISFSDRLMLAQS